MVNQIKTLNQKYFLRMAQEKIEFSDLISISGSQGQFSPSGHFFGLVYANKVILHLKLLETIFLFSDRYQKKRNAGKCYDSNSCG